MIYSETSELLKCKRTLHSDTQEKEFGTHEDIREPENGNERGGKCADKYKMDSVNVNQSQGSPNSVRILTSALEEKV